MGTHTLKTWPEFFGAVISGEKTFEVRVDDRDFEVGDTLNLHEYDPETKSFSGREHDCRVSYILRDSNFVCKGTVIMSIKPLV